MSLARRISASMVLLATLAGLAGCGGAGERVVARVGVGTITAAMLSHWMSVMAPQHQVPDPPRYKRCIARQRRQQPRSSDDALTQECRHALEALKQQVLSFLISSLWLTGEAADQGAKVSGGEVRRGLEQKRRSFANGEGEFRESLRAIAHTVADVEFEIASELASEKIRQGIRRSEPQISHAQVAAYYKRNAQRYHIPERRYFYIVENLESEALARKRMREYAHGRSIANESLHETFDRSSILDYQGEKRVILEAIFAAKPRVVAEPVELNHLYFLVEVTRVVPAHVETLAQVRAAIAQKLSAEQARRTLTGFVESWRRKWLARTDCRPWYVVQKCRQYRGPTAPEDPNNLD